MKTKSNILKNTIHTVNISVIIASQYVLAAHNNTAATILGLLTLSVLAGMSSVLLMKS